MPRGDSDKREATSADSSGRKRIGASRRLGRAASSLSQIQALRIKSQDETKWRDLERLLPTIVAMYRSQLNPTPSFPGARENLYKLRDGLQMAVDALAALPTPGLNYFLSWAPQHSPFVIRGPGGVGPDRFGKEMEPARAAAFGSDWDEYRRQEMREADLDDEGVRRRESSRRELQVAEEEVLRDADALMKATVDRQRIAAKRSESRRRHDEARRTAWRAELFLQPPVPRTPYCVIAPKLRELSALLALSRVAVDTFERDWPGPGRRGAKGNFRAAMPGRMLAAALIDLIGLFWGEAGLERVSATAVPDAEADAHSGKFLDLLVAFHLHATGEDLSDGTPFSEPLRGVTRQVDESRKRLGYLPDARRRKRNQGKALGRLKQQLPAPEPAPAPTTLASGSGRNTGGDTGREQTLPEIAQAISRMEAALLKLAKKTSLPPSSRGLPRKPPAGNSKK